MFTADLLKTLGAYGREFAMTLTNSRLVDAQALWSKLPAIDQAAAKSAFYSAAYAEKNAVLPLS